MSKLPTILRKLNLAACLGNCWLKIDFKFRFIRLHLMFAQLNIKIN